MKNQIKLLVLGVILVIQFSAFSQILNENLKFIEPMWGKN